MDKQLIALFKKEVMSEAKVSVGSGILQKGRVIHIDNAYIVAAVNKAIDAFKLGNDEAEVDLTVDAAEWVQADDAPFKTQVVKSIRFVSPDIEEYRQIYHYNSNGLLIEVEDVGWTAVITAGCET